MKLIQKKIKDRRKWLKNEYFKNLADGINTVAEARQVDKEFALAKKYSALKTGIQSTISKGKLKSHFEQHFAARDIPLPEELKSPERFPHLMDDHFNINKEKLSSKEVEKVLPSFKNGRSWGTDKLKTEALKYNTSQKLITCLLMLMSLIWSLLKVPSVWLHA